MSSDELTPIYWPQDMLQADLIRQTFQAEGIPCHLEGENLAGHYGPAISNGIQPLRLFVRASDVDRAKEIIDDGDWPAYT